MHIQLRSSAAVMALLLALSSTVRAAPSISLIGSASLSGTAHDKSGLTGTYTGDDLTIPQGQLGAFGSGITYSGVGDIYFAINDRGLANGDVHYACRMQEFRISVDPATGGVIPTLLATMLLRDRQGRQFDGNSGEFTSGLRLDPEAIRVNSHGNLYISDEYGPFIDEFDPTGKQIRRLPVPAKFEITHFNADGDAEIAANTMGRQTNRGFEGMAVTPDGMVYAMLQSPLIQDHGLDANAKRIGLNDRILQLDPVTGKSKEFLYRLDDKKNGINEMLAVNDHEFLVIERDGKAGAEAQFKKIFLIDTTGASDISATGTAADNGLPATDLPDGVVPVKKTLVIDLLDPAYGIAGPSSPEKFEGLAFGPDLPDGRHLLIVTVDNDLIPSHPNWFYAFAIDPSVLPDYVPLKNRVAGLK